MCFFERNDIKLWVNVKGYAQRLIFRLPLSTDERNYEDYFIVELPAGNICETVYCLPFHTIRDMTCISPNGDGCYTIRLELTDEEHPILELKVPAHCYSYFGFRQMQKTYLKKRDKSSPSK